MNVPIPPLTLSRRGALLVTLLSLWLMSCDKAEPPATTSAQESPRQESEEARARRLRGEAFGLPLPPRVLDIVRQGTHIFVKTDMRVRELETFYTKNLVDYEVIVVGSSMRIIPLRDKMPWIRVSRPFGPRHPLHITYIQAEAMAPPPLPAVGENGMTEERRAELLQQRRKSVPKAQIPKRGAPVELRTPEGELLAPGARWGEPYTPPPGSPLDKPRNRYNFGVPFGEWRAD